MSFLRGDKEDIYTDAAFKSSKSYGKNPHLKEITKEKKEEVKGEIKEWSKKDKEMIDWFLNLDPNLYPKPPFMLKPGVRVVDFFISLREEIERGPNQARARNGALQEDIECLKILIDRRANGQES